MAVISSIGGTLSFNTSLPAAEDASSYGALSSWAEIENLLDVTPPKVATGDTTFTPLKTGWTQHTVGAKDIENITANCAYDESDNTNIETLRGYDSTSTVLAWKYVDSAGRTWYWKGRCMSFGPTAQDADSHNGRSFEVRNAGAALIEVAPA
jgi:hypothetical protein